MASIRFNLKNPKKKEGSTPIVARVSYSGKSFKHYLGVSIPVKYWNFENQQVRQTKSFIEYVQINHLISKYSSAVSVVYLDFLSKGVNPSPAKFRERLKAEVMGVDSSGAFITFFDSFIESKRSQRAENTIKRYVTTRNHLKQYQRYTGKTIHFSDIDLYFYDNLISYLYDRFSHSANTVGRMITVIKTVMNEALEKGLTDNITFKNRRFKVPFAETTKVFLNENEIQQVYEKDFSDAPRLERVRDLFIIGCYTGLRYSDVTRLKNENIITRYYKGREIKIISIVAKKTRKKTVVPIKPIVNDILLKYTIDGQLDLPRKISNQKMNTYIKDVIRESKIKGKVEIVVSESGKPKTLVKNKWELVSSHTCRRSFATNALLSGMEKTKIMNITGHVKEKDFDNYVCLSKEELSILASEDSFFH